MAIQATTVTGITVGMIGMIGMIIAAKITDPQRFQSSLLLP